MFAFASPSHRAPAAPSRPVAAAPRRSDRLPGGWPTAPLLPLAAGAWAGASLAQGLSFNPPSLAMGLGMAAIALGRMPGRFLAGLALGLVLAAVQGSDAPGRRAVPVAHLPVEAVAEVVGPWRAGPHGRSAAVEIRWLKQRQSLLWYPRRAWLILPGVAPEASWGSTAGDAGSAGSALAPDEVAPPLGTRLRVRGYLRRPSGAWNRQPTPVGPWRLTVKSLRLVRVEREAGLLGRSSAALRRRVEAAWPATPTPGSALARALLLGDRRELPAAWSRGLRRWGLAHLLAVSGLHVGLLTAVVFAGAQIVAIPRPLRLLVALLAAGAYLLLVGPAPALVRASLMVVSAVAAVALQRIPAGWNALSWALLVLLAGRAELVADVGFQLTVAATAGLLGGSRMLFEGWRGLAPRLPGWWGRPLAASWAAQLASLPFALPRFYLLSPLGCVANLVAIPWTAVSLLGCLVWVAASSISPAAGALLMPLLDLLAAPFAWPAGATGTVSWALPVRVPPGAAGPVLAAGLAGLLFWLLCHPRWGIAVLLGVLLAGFLAGGPPSDPVSPPEIVVLDVGQGDAILLRDGPRAILVDGGGWERGDLAGRILLPALLGEGVRRLDAVVLTHADLDHCGGLAGIVDYLPARELWIAPGAPVRGCAADLLLRPGLTPRPLWEDEVATVGRWRLTALHPAPRVLGRRGNERDASVERGARRGGNEESLVLLAEVHGRRVLLTGDIGSRVERDLLRTGRRLAPLDVLKVAHHGSKSSSSRAFLRLAAPRLAIVSAGRGNRYHHPATVVVERYARLGIPLLRTDLHGAVRVAFPAAGGVRVQIEGPPLP